jgi:hypothetical protein
VIRFSWLQFRTQALVAIAGLLIVAVVAAVTGPHLAHLYKTNVSGCGTSTDCELLKQAFIATDRNLRTWLGILVVAVPALIGMFWGAPLISREVETGTFRLALTQSTTRTRWLATKLGIGALASMAAAALLSLAVTWWAHPLDRAQADHYKTFDQRDIVPIGHAAFAFMVGVTAGILIRRTLPALATTLIVFVGARLGMTFWGRAHLLSPLHRTIELADAHMGYMRSSPTAPGNLHADAPDIPNSWIYSSNLVDNSGHTLTSADVTRLCPDLKIPEPVAGSGDTVQQQVPIEAKTQLRACITKVSDSYHQVVTYQPAGRYWTLQWLELGVYLAASIALAGICFWAIRRRLS